MNKIEKLHMCFQTKGLYYTLRLIANKIWSGRIKRVSILLYYLFHNNLSQGYNGDLENWRSYLKLKKKYQSFIDSLPEYKVSDKATKIIWWCWLQGEDNAPELCKACLKSVRKHFHDYKITVITEDNINSYVEMPDYILTKYKKGIIGRAHFADILRTMLLVKYGGVWVDSTVYCTGRNDDLLQEPLFVYQDWKFDREQACVCSNWFLSARKGDPILRTTLDLVLEYWRQNNYVITYFFYHLFFHMATERYHDEWISMPRFSNIPPHLLQFEMYRPYIKKRFQQISNGSDFHKLTYKNPKITGGLEGSMYNYILKS